MQLLPNAQKSCCRSARNRLKTPKARDRTLVFYSGRLTLSWENPAGLIQASGDHSNTPRPLRVTGEIRPCLDIQKMNALLIAPEALAAIESLPEKRDLAKQVQSVHFAQWIDGSLSAECLISSLATGPSGSTGWRSSGHSTG